MNVVTYTVTAIFGWLVALTVWKTLWSPYESTGSERFSPRRWTGPLYPLVPDWNFFAPRPARYDYGLLYRIRTEDGDVGGWREIPAITDLPDAYQPAWNPDVYTVKSLVDFGDQLTSHLRPEEPTDDSGDGELAEIDDRVLLSVPYVAILNYVTHTIETERDPTDEDEVQFLVMRSEGRTTETEPVFVSRYHGLSDG